MLLRILMLTEALVAGGAELFALRLANSLPRAGIECHLVALHADHIDQRILASSSVAPEIIHIPLLRWVKRVDRVLDRIDYAPIRTRLTLAALDRQIADYDVVHSHLFGADWVAAHLRSAHPRLRAVSTLHGDYRTFEEHDRSVNERTHHHNWPTRRDFVLERIDRFVTISEQQRAQFLSDYQIPEDRLASIYNGVEESDQIAPAQRSGGPFTIAMAARGAIPEKGWRTLLSAFARLNGEVRLVLIGAGDHLDKLKEEFGSDDRICFAGFQFDPRTLMATADVFVLPTTYPAESLPTVIIEAFAVGCPVIATDVGEIGEMLRTDQGQAGTLLAVDAPQALIERVREALQRYIDDDNLRRDHGANARRAFERFSMDRCRDAYVRVYSDLVAGGPMSFSTKANH